MNATTLRNNALKSHTSVDDAHRKLIDICQDRSDSGYLDVWLEKEDLSGTSTILADEYPPFMMTIGDLNIVCQKLREDGFSVDNNQEELGIIW